MKFSWIFALSIFVAESATARGWHSYSTGPDWLYKLMLTAIGGFLLYSLVKRPIKTIGVLLGVIVFPVTMLLVFHHLDKNLGFLTALIALLVMWYSIFKFIDFVFKDDHKKN